MRWGDWLLQSGEVLWGKVQPKTYKLRLLQVLLACSMQAEGWDLCHGQPACRDDRPQGHRAVLMRFLLASTTTAAPSMCLGRRYSLWSEMLVFGIRRW